MTIEILNTFTENKDGTWAYEGQFQYKGKWVPLSGSIKRPESKSRFKSMLREVVEAQIRAYIEANKPPETFTIPVGGVFVNTLS
jgi:hypothetical protein